MKIIKIAQDQVYIGTDSGEIIQMLRSDLDFEPKVGMEVERYTSDSEIVITPKQAQSSQNISASSPKADINNPDGVVVNVTNSNNNNPNDLYTAASGKVVNKIVYILLALFLGGLGVHKFYAGRIGSGILYILFCWTFIPGIIAFIEMIIACFKPADRRGNIIV